MPFGFKEWLCGPTTPASSYLVRFRAGCPPIGEELRRRVQTDDDSPEENGTCPSCTLNTLETRGHFLVDCPAYTEARKVMMSACEGVISQESWMASESLSSETRALWLLSGCLSVPSDEGEPHPQAVGSACRWESECCTAVGAFLEIAMKKRFTLAGLSAEESVSSPLLSSREDDSDSDDDSSDDDVPLRTLIRSKPSLAGSMVSAVTSET